jgi:hypothetical protein
MRVGVVIRIAAMVLVGMAFLACERELPPPPFRTIQRADAESYARCVDTCGEPAYRALIRLRDLVVYCECDDYRLVELPPPAADLLERSARHGPATTQTTNKNPSDGE